MKDQYTLRFFLGANSPLGFVSRFDQLADPEKSRRAYILKGGPGTGKSTLLRKIADAFRAEHSGVEEIHCSSDFSSLDAVILGDTGVSVIDGTLPHAIALLFSFFERKK